MNDLEEPKNICARIPFVPQMHLYVPEALAETVRRRAQEKGVSVSRYLAELVQHEISDEWDDSFFEEVVGGWVGELERPKGLESTPRDEFP